jgi:hypothetical protein
VSPIARTALRIGIPVIILALIVAFYLRYNFNSRSSLFLVAPANADWVYHIQTRQILREVPQEAMPYLDSLTELVSKLPVFKGIDDPRNLGIDLYSDLVLFRTEAGFFLALKLNDEKKFAAFLAGLSNRGVSGIISRAKYNYVHGTEKSDLFLAYRNRALIGFMPFSKPTGSGYQQAEQVFDSLFSGNTRSISELEDYRKLQATKPHIYFWKNEQYPGRLPSVGVRLNKPYAGVQYAVDSSITLSPLLLFHHASPIAFSQIDPGHLLDSSNRISSKAYLNQTLAVICEHIRILAQ